jgi:hypothetical protein
MYDSRGVRRFELFEKVGGSTRGGSGFTFGSPSDAASRMVITKYASQTKNVPLREELKFEKLRSGKL